MAHHAQAERHALADLFSVLGPDAPTLCTGWDTGDLAAHLILRERRPDAALGVVVTPLAAYTSRLQHQTRSSRSWEELVELIRSGPPALLRPIDDTVNTVEYFVHHEDVRRAQSTWHPRQLDPDLERDLWGRLRLMGRLLARRAPTGVDLVAPGQGRARAKRATPAVTVTGPPGELVLFAFGRKEVARVSFDGDELSIERLRHASLGL
ncbi:MAG: TIGR03085 family metal-binding protein [Acidimicrobiales bacterium]